MPARILVVALETTAAFTFAVFLLQLESGGRAFIQEFNYVLL